jgi:small-conductance mechanosensitive channel
MEKKHNNHQIHHFVWLTRNVVFAFLIILISLFIGMIGYRYFESLSWMDSYVNAAMILSGMGQINPLQTENGKLFAGTYALFSGIVFLGVIAFIFAPIAHRFLHRFHVNEHK